MFYRCKYFKILVLISLLATFTLLLFSCVMKPISPYREATWSELPSIEDIAWVQGFQVWRASCDKLSSEPQWHKLCRKAHTLPIEVETIKQFFFENFKVVALRQVNKKNKELVTGYYEPVFPGSLQRTAQANVPVYGVPEDLITVSLNLIYPELTTKRIRGRLQGKQLLPYFNNGQILERNKQGLYLQAPILGWLTDPLDLQLLQLQGSGRLLLSDGQQLRLGYADQNGHLYYSIGQWLVQQKQLLPKEVTMQSIRAWSKDHPSQVAQLIASNPSYVFFRLLPSANEGPIGSLQVPLTANYSAAVDTRYIPLATPLILQTKTPNQQHVNRLIVAQDTGGAICGPLRLDLFFGTGEQAGEIAGRMQHKGKLWLLWPKQLTLPQLQPT